MNSFFVTGPKGFETALHHELREILSVVEAPHRLRKVYGGIELEGPLELAYRVCLHSRIANRVYLPLKCFKAENEEALYQEILAIDWSRHLTDHHSLAVSATLSRSAIDHSHYAALKVKDAIVDFFRNLGGGRPVIDKERPDIRVHLNIHKNRATLSLDLSGQPLHRRGYRLQHAGAPLKENLAAALLATAGWNREAMRQHSLLDPLCGSGTFVIEAAMIAASIAPGLDRDYFGFLRWKGHDAGLWQRLLKEAEAAIDEQPEAEIVGCDLSPGALDIARDNALRAGVESLIRFEQRAVEQLPGLELSKPPIIIGNPPYGERLQAEEGLATLYAQMGRAFRAFPGARVHLISANPDLLHRLRLPRTHKKAVNNGPIACVFASFSVDADQDRTKPATAVSATPSKRPTDSAEAGALRNRLLKNHKHLSRWARRNDVTCYRLYDADLPEFAFALDRYESALDPELAWFHLQEYQAPKTVDADKAAERLQLAAQVVCELFEIDASRLYVKQRQRQKGSSQYQKQDRQGELFLVREGPAKLLVNLSDYLDTGLFLDHRITRAIIREQAAGKSLLNLFCYTASVSVQAALGGARRIVSADLSATYLNWARENFAANDLEGDQYRFLQQDCLELLKRPRKHGLNEGFDIVFLDPPSFSNSKRMSDVLDIQRDHETLVRQSVELLTRGGVLYFSTNRRGFRLAEALTRDFDVRDITRQTIPEDFRRRPKIHQCWEIRRR